MEYENSDIYDGEWTNNIKKGKGIMKYSAEDVYEGEWRKNNNKEGKEGILNS